MELTRTHTEAAAPTAAGGFIAINGRKCHQILRNLYVLCTFTRLIVGQSVTFNGNIQPPTPFGFNQFTFVNKSNTNPWWPPTPTPSPIKSHTFESHVSKLLLVSSLSRARFAPSASERAGALSPFLSGEDRISIRMLLRSPENTRRRRQ